MVVSSFINDYFWTIFSSKSEYYSFWCFRLLLLLLLKIILLCYILTSHGLISFLSIFDFLSRIHFGFPTRPFLHQLLLFIWSWYAFSINLKVSTIDGRVEIVYYVSTIFSHPHGSLNYFDIICVWWIKNIILNHLENITACYVRIE